MTAQPDNGRVTTLQAQFIYIQEQLREIKEMALAARDASNADHDRITRQEERGIGRDARLKRLEKATKITTWESRFEVLAVAIAAAFGIIKT